MYTRYPEELIEEVRISNDIVDVVSEYVRLDKRGTNYFGLCPFHKEKSPSFCVSSAKQIFTCFGCGKSGNVFSFIMEIEKLDFPEALHQLADRAHISLPEANDSEEEKKKAIIRQQIIKINTEAARFFYNYLNGSQGEAARQYLKKRGISEKTIKKFGLGYSPDSWDILYKHLTAKDFSEAAIRQSGLVKAGRKGGYIDAFRARIMFPIFDLRGNVIAFGGRILDSSSPKYINSQDTPVYSKGRNLYALNFAKTSGKSKLLIVEGYMDVISLHQSGIINTVASLGTALTESQGRLLKKYAEEIIISYDADSAGQAATMRGLDILSDIGCNVKVLTVPQGKDPDEYIRTKGSAEFGKLIDNAISLMEYKIRMLKKQVDTSSIDGKIAFLNKVAELLSKIDNNVEREMYIKKLSMEYEISQESIYSEISRRLRSKSGYRQGAIPVVQSDAKAAEKDTGDIDNRIGHDEKFILALLCVDNSLYKKVQNSLNIGSFITDEGKKLASVVLERLESNKSMVPGELTGLLEKENADEFARIIMQECHCDDNLKAMQEKMKSLELLGMEKRQKEILDLLKDKVSLKEGDVGKLTIELNTLVMKRKSM